MSSGFLQVSEKILQLQDVFDYSKTSRQARFSASGDCLEGAGIFDKDIVCVDFHHYPRPPKFLLRDGESREDLCLCFGKFPSTGSRPGLMLKAYRGVILGEHSVGTHYLQPTRENYTFPPYLILGVVFAVWDNQEKLKWYKSPREYPEELVCQDTVTYADLLPCKIPQGREIKAKN